MYKLNESSSSIISTIITCCLLFICIGCSNSSIIEDKNGVKRIGDEPEKRVVIWHTYSDEETIIFEKEVIPAFEAAYPDIKIESIRQNHNQEYHTALIARATAGKSPDIIRMDYTWIPLFVERNLLQPLNNFSDFNNVTNSLQRHMVEMNTYDGETFGLPLNISTKAAIYNTTLLKKAGVSQPPETFAELIELAQSNGYIIGMSGTELWNSLPYFLALGGTIANDSFTQATGFFDSEESVDAIKQLLELHQQGVINPYMLKGSIDLWKEVYSQGKVIMIDDGPWYYSILLNSSNVDVDLLERTVPTPFPSEAGSIIGGESLVMTKYARNKDEAWTFMSWMTTQQTQMNLFKAGLIPANVDALEAGRTQEGVVNRYLSTYIEGIDQAFYRPSIPQWTEIEGIYNEALRDIFLGGQNIEQTLKSAAENIDALLAN